MPPSSTSDQYLTVARRLLKQDDFLQSASPDTIETLLAAGTIRRHSVDTLLYRRGETILDLIVILEGKLELSVDNGDGRRSILWYLPADQWVNMIPVIDGEGSIHDIRAHTETVCFHLPRSAFFDALNTDPGFGVAILKMLCERSRYMYETRATEALLPLRARVARTLALLMNYHGRLKDGTVEIDLKISQDEFAAMLSVSRQSLSRELNALQDQGVISIAYSRIIIRDSDALSKLASADPVN